MSVTGPIVSQIQAVFAVDWYYACKEVLTPADLTPPIAPIAPTDEQRENPQASAMQIIPSGPAFKGTPNLRAFVHMISSARTHVTITSPYFIPDEALITALTNATLSGVEVELFVSEQFDQFLVGHAQRSYYGTLLKAGVRIHLYRKPRMLHSKYVIVDGSLCAIGSSNMDVRSFGLNYEITLVADDARLVELLHGNDQRTRERSRELTYEEWRSQPWYVHYVDDVLSTGQRASVERPGDEAVAGRVDEPLDARGSADCATLSDGCPPRWMSTHSSGRAARTPPCAPPTRARPWPR